MSGLEAKRFQVSPGPVVFRARTDLELDQELAAGVSPSFDPLLQQRALALTSRATREQIAMALEKARVEVEETMGSGPATQMQTWRERAATLRLLAHRLRRSRSPSPKAIAAVTSLLNDPSFGDGSEPDLWLAAHSVLISLTEPPG